MYTTPSLPPAFSLNVESVTFIVLPLKDIADAPKGDLLFRNLDSSIAIFDFCRSRAVPVFLINAAFSTVTLH